MREKPRGIPVTLTDEAWGVVFNRIGSRHPAAVRRRVEQAYVEGTRRRRGSRTAWVAPADSAVMLDVVEWLAGWFPQKRHSPAEARALVAQLRVARRNLTVPRQIHGAILAVADLAA